MSSWISVSLQEFSPWFLAQPLRWTEQQLRTCSHRGKRYLKLEKHVNSCTVMVYLRPVWLPELLMTFHPVGNFKSLSDIVHKNALLTLELCLHNASFGLLNISYSRIPNALQKSRHWWTLVGEHDEFSEFSQSNRAWVTFCWLLRAARHF